MKFGFIYTPVILGFLTLPLFSLRAKDELKIDKQEARSIKEFVQRLHHDTKNVLFEKPKFYSNSGDEVKLFPFENLKEKNLDPQEFIKFKLNMRKENYSYLAHEQDQKPTSNTTIIKSNDLVEDIVDNSNNVIRSIVEIENKGLLRAEVSIENRPWSGWIWPYNKGSLGGRYFDEKFNAINTFKESWEYVWRNSVENMKEEDIRLLSPAEKYDLVMGSDILTNESWQLGNKYLLEDGYISEWFGHCNGWSYASFMTPLPEHAVTLKSFDKKHDVLFYTSDIKALATLAWSRNSGPEKSQENRFIGARCQKTKPATDSKGRIIDPDCFDTNPGTFFLSVINQIGISHRSLAMDSIYDYEVWNYPILGYNYFYFNPQNGESSGELNNDVMIERKDFEDDPFSKYRDHQTKYIVGIQFNVRYKVVQMPIPELRADHKKDTEAYTQRYKFDLELNTKKEVIGGEWYQNIHPDFLATPSYDAKPYTEKDKVLLGQLRSRIGPNSLIDFKENQTVPSLLADTARLTPGQVSGLFLEKLVYLSRTIR